MSVFNTNLNRTPLKFFLSVLCILLTISNASAACNTTGDAAITTQHCGSDYISYLTGTGSLTLTIQDESSTTVDLNTTNNLVTDTDHTLILTGNTVLNRPDYSAVVMQTYSENRNATVQVGENVSITAGGIGFGAIWVRNDTSGDVSIDNAGEVTDYSSYGISGTTNSGSVSINNSGTVTSTTYRGIYADGGYNNTIDAPVEVSITNTGTVNAYEAGLRAINYMGEINIDNGGDVNSTNRQGIVGWTADGGGININNSGSVESGNDIGIQAAGTNGDVTVTNSGTVTATKSDSIAPAGSGFSGIYATVDMGTVTVTNSSTGIINAEDDYGVYAETADGEVSVRNAGHISSLVGISGVTSKGAVSIENSGTVDTSSTAVNLEGTTSNTFTNTGTIKTEGAVAVQTNDSDTTIINSGIISAGSEADTAIALGAGNNRLILNSGSQIVGKVVAGNGDDKLVLGGTGTGEIDADDIDDSGKYQGFETVEKRDEGTWEVSGISNDLNWTVYSGTLSVSGVVKNIDVEQGGTLSGTGNIGSIVVNSGGTLAPGNSIGTTSADDVTFTTGSSFEVEVDSAGNSDKVLASGTVTIDSGATIYITPENGTDDGSAYDPYTTYTIISADGGITGTFENVVDDFAFLDVRLNYDSNSLYMGLQRNNVAFQSITDSANQRNIAGIVTGFGSGSTLYDAVVRLDEAGARKAFDKLSGEVHASLKTMLIDDTRFFREAVSDRTSAVGDSSYHAWGTAFGSWGNWDGDGNASELERSIGGIVAGFERVFDNSASAGFAFGYSYTDFDADSVSSSGSVDSYNFGIYAEKEYEALGVLLGASYGIHKIDTDRDIEFAEYDDSADGDYDASTSQVFGEVSYNVAVGKGKVSPFFSSAYITLNTDGFSEDGGESALKVSSSYEDAVLTSLGVRAEGSYMLGSMKLKPIASIAWQHRFDEGADESRLAFKDGSSFSAYGVSYTRDTALIKLGVSNSITENSEIDFAYSGQFSEDVNDQSLKANLNIKF